MLDTIVLYYTQSGVASGERGNTEIVADLIQQALSCDILRISSDEQTVIQNSWFMNNKRLNSILKKRPTLTSYLTADIDYQNIIICSPCWWSTFPPTVLAQLDILNFDGKNVACVVTHEGGGQLGCYKRLQKYCKRANRVEFESVHKDEINKNTMRLTRWAETCFN